MTIPTTTQEYHIAELGSIKNIAVRESSLKPPASTEVLVKIHAVSLNYRDLLIAKNTYSMDLIPDPVICSDMGGEIIAVGDGVKGWSIGDRVCANFATDHVFGDMDREISLSAMGGPSHGVLTKYKVFPAHSLVKIPEHFSYEEASTLPCAAVTAYNALMGPAPLKGGDIVLVQGTGGVSIFALQLAVASGAIVIATSSSDEKLKIAKKLGATHLINYNTTPDWEKEVMKITNGRGVDHIIEVGGPGTLSKSLQAIKYSGYIHIIGFVAQGDNSGLDNMSVIGSILGRGAILRGIRIGSVVQFQDMNRLISATKLRPVVDSVFSFEDVLKAYEHLESQKHIGKVVIKVSSD